MRTRLEFLSVMRRGLIGGLLFVGISTPSLAGKGEIKITNCGTEKVWIGAYDWDDVATEIDYSSDTFKTGGAHTLKCVKSWSESSSPGCQIVIKDGTSAGMVMALWKVHNGTYTLGSTSATSSDECSRSVSLCLKKQSSCSSTQSDNTSGCDKSKTFGFTNLACKEQGMR